jgi:hypothetical protein
MVLKAEWNSGISHGEPLKKEDQWEVLDADGRIIFTRMSARQSSVVWLIWLSKKKRSKAIPVTGRGGL